MITDKKKAPAGEAGATETAVALSSNQSIPQIAYDHNLLDNVPPELIESKNWVVHKAKIPYDPRSGYGAKANDKTTWCDFATASAAVPTGGYDGVGYEFDGSGIVGIDLDTVRDPESGRVAKEAEEIITSLASYTEISPSGYGFHIFCRADAALEWNKIKLPANGIERPDIDPKTGQHRVNKRTGELKYKEPEVEMYREGRYFTVTGNVYGEHREIEDRTEQVKALQVKYAKKPTPRASQPRDVLAPRASKDYLAIGLKNDSKFKHLWDGGRPSGDESADDISLMNKLAYWCNCDEQQMIDAFLSSPHALSKDDQHHKKAFDRRDYMERTAKKAIIDCAVTAEQRDAEYWQRRRTPARKANQQTLNEARNLLEIFDTIETDPELLKMVLNDAGNSRRLIHVYGDIIKYSSEANAWYIWNEKKWEHDLTNKISRLALHTAMLYNNTAVERMTQLQEEFAEWEKGPDAYRSDHGGQDAMDPKLFKPVKTHALNSGNAARINAAVEKAGAVKYVLQSDLDKDPHLLTCNNGTIDLRTATLQPHNKDSLITRMVDEDYVPNAAAPTFYQFLDRIFQGDEELIRYVQTVMGYCITGETREQCFFIGHGTGANGKSTLIDAVSDLMEEHTQVIPSGVLMDKEKESGATPELARAKGARLIVASESKDISSFNEAQIKNLTGGDKISARPLYSQGFDFKPLFKIWLSTNHKPNIKGTDNGIWRRVHLIPFMTTIPEDEQDPRLPEKLKAERQGILAWMVQGAQRYYTEGLKKPDIVKRATDEYRSEMDLLGGFLDDCTTSAENGVVSAKKLYAAFQGYCDDNGIPPLSVTAFGRKMGEKGFIKKKISVFYYQGIELSKRGEELADPQAFSEVPPPEEPPPFV